LGPVEAVVSGDLVRLGGRRQRALLALLVLERGRPVAMDKLADELWAGRPPDGFRTTLRSYVSRLRGALGGSVVPVSGGSAYALQVAAEAVDVFRFERLAEEGRAALERGAVARAADRLRAALGLWRGPALADVADEGALRLEAQRLEELRLLALEQRVEAELDLGRAEELVDELEALVREHPFRERLWRHLMLALYRAERQADALAVYRRARAILAEELGLEPGEQLRALEQAILRQEVPPVRPPQQRHNLPAPVTSFVGREAELAEIEELLAENRLVTLTGVGGVGKTRLALEAAARALGDCPGGVVFCDLASLAAPELVPRALAGALDLREPAQGGVLDALVTRLREADLLLLLDNCEHLRDACAELAHGLLSSCPRLRILATSRAALGAAGEVDYAVQPLSLPSPGAGPQELSASDAVALFLARARAVRPQLAPDAAALATAARICAEVDGLPLAIELAAARLKALSLDEIAARLADRFRFLVAWRRLTPARHRTLREALDWSHALLSDDERTLLARLAAFRGGFTLAAAAAVCLDGDEERALDLVGRLVDASLVVAEETCGQTRYRLLETVRQYGEEQLAARGETGRIRRRHRDYMLLLVEEKAVGQQTRLTGWAEEIGRERANLRAALEWSRDAGEDEELIRLAAAVWRFWWVSGDLTEGRAWLETALERGRDLDPALRARAFEGAAGLAWAHGDLDSAQELARAALPLFVAAEDRRGEESSLIILGHVALAREQFRAARDLFGRARVLAEQGRSSNVAVATHNLGSVAFGEGDLERAECLYLQAFSRYGEAGDAYGVALAELYLGLVAVEASRGDEAAGYLRRALPVFREMGFLQYAAQCVDGVAAVALARGRPHEAARLRGRASRAGR